MTKKGQTGGIWEVGKDRGIEFWRKGAGGTENEGMVGQRQDTGSWGAGGHREYKLKRIEGAKCDTWKLSGVTAQAWR